MAPRAGNDESTNVLYGLHTVTEALQSPTRVIERLWLAKLDGRFFPLTHLAKERHIPFSVESRERLDRLAGDRHHQGVVAKVAAKQYLDGEELLDEVEQRNVPSLLVVLDQIQDPHNLGAIAPISRRSRRTWYCHSKTSGGRPNSWSGESFSRCIGACACSSCGKYRQVS